MAEIIKFDKSILDTHRTYKYYERQRNKYLQQQKTWVSKGDGSMGPGYSAWMCGRRMADYRYFYNLQLSQIHDLALGGTFTVCSCGLAIDGKFEEQDLLETIGHVEVQTLEVVTLFIANSKLICQGCGELGDVDEDLQPEEFAALVKKARADHSCDLKVTKTLRNKVAKLIAAGA